MSKFPRTMVRFGLQENEHYKLFFTRFDEECDGTTVTRKVVERPARFWQVLVKSPQGINTVFVLAEDEEAAKGQAQCVLECASYQVASWHEELIETEAKEIKFAVQGWGRRLIPETP